MFHGYGWPIAIKDRPNGFQVPILRLHDVTSLCDKSRSVGLFGGQLLMRLRLLHEFWCFGVVSEVSQIVQTVPESTIEDEQVAWPEFVLNLEVIIFMYLSVDEPKKMKDLPLDTYRVSTSYIWRHCP